MAPAEKLNRRTLLKHVVQGAGRALLASLMAGLPAAFSRPLAQGLKSSQALSPDERELVGHIAETIIPQTDTPGAQAAGVGEFIEHIVADWYSQTERDAFREGLVAFEKECRRRFQRPFAALSSQERIAFLEPLDAEALAARRAGAQPLPFFARMKELTLVGYYTSKAGMEAIGYYGPVGAALGQFGPNRGGVWN